MCVRVQVLSPMMSIDNSSLLSYSGVANALSWGEGELHSHSTGSR